MRKDLAPAPVIGRIGNTEYFFKMMTGNVGTLDKKGTILAWLDPEKEPSRHFIDDLVQNKKVLENWNGSILLLFRTEKDKDIFVKKNSTVLPSKTKPLITANRSLEDFLKIIQKKTVLNLPVVTFINPANEVIYFSEGYKIGIIDEILSYLHPENKK